MIRKFVAAALVTCLPVYYAVVAGSLSAEAVQQVPPDQVRRYRWSGTAWQAG